jgi:SAM-dependent methyltransferase
MQTKSFISVVRGDRSRATRTRSTGYLRTVSERWKSFWEAYRLGDVETEADLFAQVGRTVDGAPITPAQFERTIRRICEKLELESSDTLFDYCCGNGLVTHAVAARVRRIIAIDFTERLIEVARGRRQAPNVEYHVGDALEPIAPLVGRDRPAKYLMCGALSFFDPAELSTILGHVLEVSDPGRFRFFLTGIPDADRKWNFFDTPERRAAHLNEQRGEAPTGIGRWWSGHEIAEVAEAHGLTAEVEPEPGELNDYRLDALIR